MKVLCPGCHKERAVNVTGKMRTHLTRSGTECRGSQRQVSEPLPPQDRVAKNHGRGSWRSGTFE